MKGTLHVGTSGFAYPAWAPAFYPPGLRGDALLPYYASRLAACELNNTYYQQPTAPKIQAWLAATPDTFRFTVKAQRGGSIRALVSDPAGTIPWLTAPYRLFGERLGSVLYRVPGEVERDNARLRALLGVWPADLPVTFEFQHPSWIDDEVLAMLKVKGAAICATELDGDPEPPRLFLTARFLYLRLRREAYDSAGLDAWAARLVPFLDAGTDVFVFFRHDETGISPTRALDLARRVELVGAST